MSDGRHVSCRGHPCCTSAKGKVGSVFRRVIRKSVFLSKWTGNSTPLSVPGAEQEQGCRRPIGRFSLDSTLANGGDAAFNFSVVCGRYTASSVTVAERPRVVRRRLIAVATKATKTKRSRLATFNAEVKAWTIRIRLIRALVGFVHRAIIKVIVAVGRQGLLSERPTGGSC